MPVWDYECRLCREVVPDAEDDLTAAPCANPTCEGRLRRVWTVNVSAVPGGGGSPGRFGGSKHA
jgi:predicted nucleic acid-binding Zn ribbon protein